MHENVISLDELFIPQSFERENYCAHLYTPFSVKLNRRVYLYTHNMYDLWVWLETSQTISKFNEKTSSFPVNLANGHATKAAPKAVSVDFDGLITIHTIKSQNITDPIDSNVDWESWCKYHGYLYQCWSKDSLKSNSIELASLKRLLRFSCVAGMTIDFSMETHLISELSNLRKITIYKLLTRLPFYDSAEIYACIANLIIRGKIYSDIHLYPLSVSTELSVHHEFK